MVSCPLKPRFHGKHTESPAAQEWRALFGTTQNGRQKIHADRREERHESEASSSGRGRKTRNIWINVQKLQLDKIPDKIFVEIFHTFWQTTAIDHFNETMIARVAETEWTEDHAALDWLEN